MSIVLPKQKVKAELLSPSTLIVFSKPKVGKTSLLAELEDALILDIEKGAKYVDSMKIEINSIEHIFEVGKAIKDAGNPYKYIVLDTITKLEELCIPYAEKLYSLTAMGKNWFKRDAAGKLTPDSGKAMYRTITNLPNGAGYQYVREAMTKVVEFCKTLAPRIILVGHIKDTLLEKNGVEFTVSDLNLTGKIKNIMTSQADAIGYMYRRGNKNYLSFKTSDEVTCGARPAHLKNKEILISELTDEGFVTYWNEIYID
jgi:hypothetical protein